jgi:hypothetical protein
MNDRFYLLTMGEILEAIAREFELAGKRAKAARARAELAKYQPMPPTCRRALASMREHAQAGRFDVARERADEAAPYFLPLGRAMLFAMLASAEREYSEKVEGWKQ